MAPWWTPSRSHNKASTLNVSSQVRVRLSSSSTSAPGGMVRIWSRIGLSETWMVSVKRKRTKPSLDEFEMWLRLRSNSCSLSRQNFWTDWIRMALTLGFPWTLTRICVTLHDVLFSPTLAIHAEGDGSSPDTILRSPHQVKIVILWSWDGEGALSCPRPDRRRDTPAWRHSFPRFRIRRAFGSYGITQCADFLKEPLKVRIGEALRDNQGQSAGFFKTQTELQGTHRRKERFFCGDVESKPFRFQVRQSTDQQHLRNTLFRSDFESAITERNDEFKVVLIARLRFGKGLGQETQYSASLLTDYCAQVKRCLHSTLILFSNFTEVHSHGDDRLHVVLFFLVHSNWASGASERHSRTENG